jgi:hypothetical protein
MSTFLSSGDFGDIIYALPSIRALGGGTIFFANRPWTRTRWSQRVLAVIKPLIDGTGYCEAQLHDGEWIDYDFSSFRHGGYKLGDTIVERQRRWVGAPEIYNYGHRFRPWLRAEGNHVAPIVINRAARWHGFDFPWRQIVKEFYDDIVFIGLQSEHEAFQKEFGQGGRGVFFCPTENLLEAAEVIAGCDLFIGNQSACNAIANGLGKSIVLEVCPYGPDCFLRKENSFFSFNGEVEIEAGGAGGSRKLSIPPRSEGKFSTAVGDRVLFSDDQDKLRVMARGLHAYNGTFAFYDDVELNSGILKDA